MRRFVLALATFFLVALVVFGQDGASKTETITPTTPCAPTWSGSWSASVNSHYFGSIVDAVFADEPVVWNVLNLSRCLDGETSLTWTLWNSEGFQKKSFSGYANETDLWFGISRKVGKFDASVAGSIFILNPNAGTDVLLLDNKIGRTLASAKNVLTPYVEFDWYGVTDNKNFHGGIYPMVGANYARKLSGKLSLVMHYHESKDFLGAFGKKKNADIFFSQAGLRIALSDSWAITVPRFAVGGSWDDPGRPRKATWSGEISKTF